MSRAVRLCTRFPLGAALFLALLLVFLAYQNIVSGLFSGEINPDKADAPKYAFATFLAGNTMSESDLCEDDPYFMSVRHLAYKLLHTEPGRSRSIPLLVLCTSAVSALKRARLEKDGATVIPVEYITSPSVIIGQPRWQDVLTKLRLFELTDYTKICFMDADIFVVDDLSGIFEDLSTYPQRTRNIASQLRSDEAALPDLYLMAGHNDFSISANVEAGFFVFSPSRSIFDYYMSLLDKPERFQPPGYPEQGVLNYAHRQWGNMPWRRLPQEWRLKFHHDKFWLCETPSLCAARGCYCSDDVVFKEWKAERKAIREYWNAREPKTEDCGSFASVYVP